MTIADAAKHDGFGQGLNPKLNNPRDGDIRSVGAEAR